MNNTMALPLHGSYDAEISLSISMPNNPVVVGNKLIKIQLNGSKPPWNHKLASVSASYDQLADEQQFP